MSRGFVNPTFVDVYETTNDSESMGGSLFPMYEALIAAGWTIMQSSDGTTYSDSGNVIDTAAKLGALRAWFVMRSPRANDLGEQQEWCVQRTVLANTSSHRVKHSRGAGFTGGSPDATTVPSATDEAVTLGAGTDASPTGGILFNNWLEGAGTATRAHHGCVDSDSDAFYFTQYTAGATGGTGTFAWYCDPITEPVDGDDYPYVVGVGITSTAWIAATLSSGTEGSNRQWAYFTEDGGSTWTAHTIAAGQDFRGAIAVPDNLEANGVTGLPELHAWKWGRQDNFTGGRYTKGWSSLFLWVGNNYSTPYRRLFDDGDSVNGLIALGEQVVGAWDESTPVGPSSGDTWTAVGGTTIFDSPSSAAPADETAPTLTPTKAGGYVRRHEALTYVAADNVAITNLTISIRYEGDDAPTVVYDGSRFWGRFHGVSTIVGDATEKTITLLPHGGWRRRIASLHFKVNDGNFAV